jgi:ketosteroid isomerase-like protein
MSRKDLPVGKKHEESDDVEVIKGKVVFDSDEELGDVEASDDDIEAIVKAVKAFWDRYLHMDLDGFGALLADDVTRMSQRTRDLQQGAKAVLAGMKKEWEAFERPGNLISEEMTLRSMEISVNDEEEASAATVTYWVEIEGGARWHYDDQGVVLQAFEKKGDRWRLVHQIDAWSTDYDLDEEEPGDDPTFVYDYVYPAADLARAVAFYRPLLGEPDAVVDGRAYFGLRGPRFILDSFALGGHAVVRKNLPNGYALVYVSDLDRTRKELIDKGVTFLAGTDEDDIERCGDRIALLRDVSGNVVALTQRDFSSAQGPSELRGLDGDDPYIEATRELARAWLSLDAAAIAGYHGDDGVWFDDTRTSARGFEGGDQLEEALAEVYWPHYDRSDDGICARLEASSVQVRKVGEQTLVSYVRSMVGTGPHPFRERALVTHVFDDDETVSCTIISSATRNDSMVIELDYTGHPVIDLKKAEKFYTQTLEFGEPYVDDEWRGWWSNNAVYGAYTSDPDSDGIPQKDRTNGYVSLWVRSVEETHAYLEKLGVNFPLIASINQKKGVERYPGYNQIVSNDSEGNVVVFTEYSGKKK